MKVKRGAFQKKIICNSQSTRSRLDKLHVIDMEETGMATWPGGGVRISAWQGEVIKQEKI